MKNQLLGWILLLGSWLGFAQNYQGIRSNQISYFGNPELSYILATRTDSLELIGADSIFYSFKTIRANPDSPLPLCEYTKGPNWYGEKVIIRPSGEHVFLNRDSDSIFIQTLANLNDTFRVYVYPDLSDTIYGWVSDYDTLPVLGVIDTIKIIHLFHANGSPATPTMLSISKNHGFIHWFAPWSFPEPYTGPTGTTIPGSADAFHLVGTEFPRTGITKPLIGEVYDFDVNDQFIFLTTTEYSSGYWNEKYIERTILDKIVGSNSVTYLMYDTTRSTTNSLETTSTIVSYTGDLYSVTYNNLDQWLNNYMPEECIDFAQGLTWKTLSVDTCARTKERNVEQSFDQFSGDCYTQSTLALMFFERSWSYVAGVGEREKVGHEMYDGDYADFTDQVLYCAKSNDTCGTISYMSISNDHLNSQPAFVLFPNPTDDFVIIQTENDQVAYSELQLLDATGKLIRSESLKETNLTHGHTLLTSELQPGIYFLMVYSENQQYVFKLVRK